MNDEHVAGKIRTVLGPITPEQLGICMVHEHLIVDAWKMWPVPNYSLIIDDVGLVTEEVQAYRTAGGTSIVDVTNIGLGRDPQALQRISEATGVQIVMGCIGNGSTRTTSRRKMPTRLRRCWFPRSTRVSMARESARASSARSAPSEIHHAGTGTRLSCRRTRAPADWCAHLDAHDPLGEPALEQLDSSSRRKTLTHTM